LISRIRERAVDSMTEHSFEEYFVQTQPLHWSLARAEANVASGSWLFSNSGVECQALRGVPAGFTVLFAVGALALCMMALEDVGGSMCESRLPR
jgi:hypothetical protein